RRPVPDALLRGHRHDPGGYGRRAHHAVWYASRPAAPDAPSVADVLRAIHRSRIVLLGAGAGSESPSGAIHDRAHARAADSAVVWGDVLLVVEGPRPPRVTSARPTRSDVTRCSREVNPAERCLVPKPC